VIDAAIVLAAGRGTRLGGPKALLRVRGVPLIVQHLRRLRELGCARMVFVVPDALAAEATAVLADPAALVVGVDTSSQAESLQRGLRALDAALASDACLLITPVDLVPPRLDTLRALAAAMDAGASAVAPSHAGRHGHPLLVRRRLLDEYTNDDEPLPPLNRVVAERRHFVEVDDAAVLADLDEPADVARVERG
jgi:CTP:molybdopterin cytidylyltransferase MocA